MHPEHPVYSCIPRRYNVFQEGNSKKVFQEGIAKQLDCVSRIYTASCTVIKGCISLATIHHSTPCVSSKMKFQSPVLSFVVCVYLNIGVGVSFAAHSDLHSEYRFEVVLFEQGDQYYDLHWNFTKESETIYFAVNVSTIGWVGFGLSPNGLMPNSDVVMGWVDGENTFFHVSTF